MIQCIQYFRWVALLSLLLVFGGGCGGGLSEDEAANLIYKSWDNKYALGLNIPQIDVALYSGQRDTFSGPKAVKEWLKENGYIIPDKTGFTITPEGYQYFRNTPSIVDKRDKYTRTIYFCCSRWEKPKIIGIRDLDNDKYEVRYLTQYSIVEEPYVQFVPRKFAVREPEEQTRVYVRYGDEWRSN